MGRRLQELLITQLERKYRCVSARINRRIGTIGKLKKKRVYYMEKIHANEIHCMAMAYING